MAVVDLSLEEVYNAVKDSEKVLTFTEGGVIGTINIRATLKPDLIPTDELNVVQLNRSIWATEYKLGIQFDSSGYSDSDVTEYHNLVRHLTVEDSYSTPPLFQPPEYIKIYSTNYDGWLNLEVQKIDAIANIDVE